MPSPSAVEKYLAYKKKPKEKLHATSLLMPPTIECFTRIRNFKMLLRSGCETRLLRGGPRDRKVRAWNCSGASYGSKSKEALVSSAP
jgi:hypothetical protein